MTDKRIQIHITESGCDWFSVSGIIRNLIDQPSKEFVIFAIKMAEEFLSSNLIIPIPGLINAIVKNVSLQYLRSVDINIILKLAEISFAVDNAILQMNITDHYPALPGSSFFFFTFPSPSLSFPSFLPSFLPSFPPIVPCN